MKNLFSVEHDDIKLIIRVLGIKMSFKDKRNWTSAAYKHTKQMTVLSTEPLFFEAEAFTPSLLIF